MNCEVCQDDGWIPYPTWADTEKKVIRIRKVACPKGCPLKDPQEKGVLPTFPRDGRMRDRIPGMQSQKLLPPDHPDAPKFWQQETSGVLQPVVAAYLNGQTLTPEQVRLMRAYLYQWVCSPVWAPSGSLEALRLRVASIETDEDMEGCMQACVDLGMDPL